MRILVIGATGATGLEVVKQGLAAGHTITAFVRNPRRMTLTDTKLRVIRGDATNVSDLTAAMKGQDAVIVTLGPKSMKDMNQLTAITTRSIVAAMQQAGVQRIILMSSFVALRSQLKFGTKLAARTVMKGMVNDKLSGEQLLRDSELAWTVVYPTKLTDEAKTGKYRVVGAHERLGMSNSIARAEVAAAMLTLLADHTAVRKAVAITAH